MPDNKRSPAPWDERQEGAVPALRGSFQTDKGKRYTLTDDERAFLEQRKAELENLANGPGRESLTDDDKWLHSQFRDEGFYGDNLTAAGLVQDAKQIQFHGEALGRTLRNLARFDEAAEIVASLPNPTRETVMLAESIRDWQAAVEAGGADCGCERVAQSYVDKTQRFKSGHPTITITPNRTHRAERIVLDGQVRWLYRCSICMALSLPDEMPERHQAVHEARSGVMAAVRDASRNGGEPKPFAAVGDAELLK